MGKLPDTLPLEYSRNDFPPLWEDNNSGNSSDEFTQELTRTLKKQRFKALETARNLLIAEAFAIGERLKFLANFHRTCKCYHTRNRSQVNIWKSGKTGSCSYSGVITCGSVWSCPVCSHKVMIRRQQEIEQAVYWAYKSGKQCILVTFTFPHYAFQSAKELLEKQRKALDYFRGGKAWQRKKALMGMEGLIKSLEVTLGENGWHPHSHELWIVDADIKEEKLEALKAYVLERWEKACIHVGIIDGQSEAFNNHSVDIKGDVRTSDYLAKMATQQQNGRWGVEKEMTKGASKSSQGEHPFNLLEDPEKIWKKYDTRGDKFVEYCMAFKGKRQIVFSKGLKKKCGLKDIDNNDIVTEKDLEGFVLFTIGVEDWKKVQKERAQGLLLYLGERFGEWKIEEWFIDRENLSCI